MQIEPNYSAAAIGEVIVGSLVAAKLGEQTCWCIRAEWEEAEASQERSPVIGLGPNIPNEPGHPVWLELRHDFPVINLGADFVIELPVDVNRLDGEIVGNIVMVGEKKFLRVDPRDEHDDLRYCDLDSFSVGFTLPQGKRFYFPSWSILVSGGSIRSQAREVFSYDAARLKVRDKGA